MWIAVVAVCVCVLLGIATSIAMILKSTDPASIPTGEYILLFVVNITMWSPIMLITAWFVSLPVIVVLGLLAAYVRVVDQPERTGADADPPRPTQQG
ncbi:hypothetical protein [Mycolicibacterium lutetiense]